MADEAETVGVVTLGQAFHHVVKALLIGTAVVGGSVWIASGSSVALAVAVTPALTFNLLDTLWTRTSLTRRRCVWIVVNVVTLGWWLSSLGTGTLP